MRDVKEATWEQIEDELVMICVCQAVATGRLMVLLAEVDRRGQFAQSGQRTLAHWLSWRTGTDIHTAREYVRVAKKVTELPVILDALCRGEIVFSKARALTRIAKPETEAELLGFAKS